MAPPVERTSGRRKPRGIVDPQHGTHEGLHRPQRVQQVQVRIGHDVRGDRERQQQGPGEDAAAREVVGRHQPGAAGPDDGDQRAHPAQEQHRCCAWRGEARTRAGAPRGPGSAPAPTLPAPTGAGSRAGPAPAPPPTSPARRAARAPSSRLSDRSRRDRPARSPSCGARPTCPGEGDPPRARPKLATTGSSSTPSFTGYS